MKPYLYPQEIVMIRTCHKSGCLRDGQLYWTNTRNQLRANIPIFSMFKVSK